MNSHEETLPPSMLAAHRSRSVAAGGSQVARAYPVAPSSGDPEATAAELAATRALLDASSPQEVVDVVTTLVRDLGGGLLPARLDSRGAALPLDVSLGIGQPMLPWADPVSVEAMRLARVMPPFLEGARTVLRRLQAEERAGRRLAP